MTEYTESPSNMSDEDPTKLCGPCKFRGINRQAGTHCQDCSEDLCDLCEEIHRSLKATRDHDLKPFEERKKTSIKQRNLISTLMTCEDHRSEVMSLLCLDHNKPTCRQCKLTKHRKCKTNTLQRVAEQANSKEKMAQFAEKVKELTHNLHELKESREQTKEVLQSCSEELTMEIKKFKEEIVTWANNLERVMLDEVESTRGKLFTVIDEEVQTAGEMLNQLDEVANSLDILGIDVPTTSLVITLKEQSKLDEGEEIKNDILNDVKPVKMSFNPSSKLVTALSEITSMGTLTTDMKDESDICFQDIISLSKKQDESSICFQEISSLSKMETINIGTSGVTGCVFMPDGELVVCEGNGTQTVKVMTRDFILKHGIELSSRAWDVAVVSQDEVIVTQPESKSLQVLKVSYTLEKGKSFHVDMRCYGVECKNDMIYVSCHSKTGNGGTIKVLTMTGVTLSSFNMDQGNPFYLAVNGTGDRIMICTGTYGASLVLCTDTTGKVLYMYKDSELSVSRGMMVDSGDNVMVCGRDSYNIHVVKKDGTKHRVILTSGDGMDEPYCLAYRASDRTLVVGQYLDTLAFTLNK